MSLSFTLSQALRMRFWQWFDEEAKGGGNFFVIKDYSRDGWPLGDGNGNHLTDEDGNVLVMAEEMLAQFDQLPSEKNVGVIFIISFSVLGLPL